MNRLPLLDHFAAARTAAAGEQRVQRLGCGCAVLLLVVAVLALGWCR